MTLSTTEIMQIALYSEDCIIKKEQLKTDFYDIPLRSRILIFSTVILRLKSYLTDDEILFLASESKSKPIWPFDLKDDVNTNEIKEQIIRFTKRIQKEKLATGEIN